MKTHALTAAAAILIGFVGAWVIYRPKPVPPEKPAPEIRHADGAVTLERKPETPGEAPKFVSKSDLPPGAKIEREVQVVVSQKPSAGGRDTPQNPQTYPPGGSQGLAGGGRTGLSIPPELKSTGNGVSPCPPITVDLALVRLKDQSRRVIASSPDGSIVGGVDIPVEPPPAIPRIQRWTAAALVGYDSHVGRNVFGGDVSYSRGPFVVQGGVIGGTAFAGAGIRF